MPERLIPWKTAANELGGEARVATGVASSAFALDAVVDGVGIRVTGRSVPYAYVAGWTSVHAVAPQKAAFSLRVTRERGSWFKRLGGRDITIGDAPFDARWIIRTSDEAWAQAWLGPTVRATIDAVPGLEKDGLGPDLKPRTFHYEFSVRGRRAVAKSIGLEEDADRLVAAMRAVAALARRGETLLEDWMALTAPTDGRLHFGRARWQADGSVRIETPTHGVRVNISPVAVGAGWRRRRLRTRVFADRATGHDDAYTIVSLDHPPAGREHTMDAVEVNADAAPGLAGYQVRGRRPVLVRDRLSRPITEAIAVAGPVSVIGTRQRITADLDGNVTDVQRLVAAKTFVALLARASGSDAGPYR